MEGDLSVMLQSVLSDPAQMEQLSAMAKSLVGDGAAPPPPPEPKPENHSMPPAGTERPIPDSKLLSVLTGLLGRGMGDRKQTRSGALLSAMRPYMKPEKQEKLDRAMQIAQMVRIAGTVMRELGGNGDGL